MEGLAADELRYIANYFGARVLDPELKSGGCREVMAQAVERFQLAGASEADPADPYTTHKMMVLLEYLALCHRRPARAVSLRAGAA